MLTLLPAVLPWYSFAGIGVSGFGSGLLAWLGILATLAATFLLVSPRLMETPQGVAVGIRSACADAGERRSGADRPQTADLTVVRLDGPVRCGSRRPRVAGCSPSGRARHSRRVCTIRGVRGEAGMKFVIRVVILALVAAACGGGAAEPTNQEESAPVEQEEAAAPPAAAGSGFCTRAAQVIAAFTGTGDLEDAVAAMEALAGEAPVELRADLEMLAEANRTFLETGNSEGLNEDEIDAAGDRVDAFLQSECGLTDPDEDQFDDGSAAGSSNTYQMTSTGAYTFEHTGEASCWLVSGGFGVEFFSDQDSDIAYDAAADAEKAVPGTYEGDLGFYTPDEEFALGPATITIEEVNDAGNDAVEVRGSIEGSYESEELGNGQVTGSFSCLITAEEAAGEY